MSVATSIQLPTCGICDEPITRLSHPKKTFLGETGRAGQVLDGQAMFCDACGKSICGRCYRKLNGEQQSCPYCRKAWGDKKLSVGDTIGLGHHGHAALQPPPPAPTVPTYPVPVQYTSFIAMHNGIVVPRQMPPGHSSWGFHVGGPSGSPSPLALLDAWNEWWKGQGHPDLLPDD